MTFASLEFVVLLVLTFAVYYFLPQRARMVLLVAVSYVFYCYWHPFYGVLILASTLIDYFMALVIDRESSKHVRRAALLASIAGNLGMLGYFKYTNFALDALRSLLGPLGTTLPGPLQLVLPVGISFYTFQTMSYTIDVYRGERRAERDFLLVALYVCFFPQLVAGPIERSHDLMPQLRRRQALTLRNMEGGVRLILWGFLKKLVLADRLALAGYPVFQAPSGYGASALAFAGAAMLVTVYLDFSAYAEIATGAARLFGIRLSRNFNFPHTAGNAAEYWRRWHITMSSWVRDYLYKPLGGFRPRNIWHDCRVTLITMALVGLWHGANWTFVLWGLAHGTVLLCYRVLYLHVLRRFRRSPVLRSVPWRLGSWALRTGIHVLIVVLWLPQLRVRPTVGPYWASSGSLTTFMRVSHRNAAPTAIIRFCGQVSTL